MESPVEISGQEPSLLPVFKEIAEKLLRDDWSRISTPDGDQAYYIVGSQAQYADFNGQADFSRCDFPLPVPLGPISESVVRSQVADNKTSFQDHLNEARKQMEKAGLAPASIDRLIQGNLEVLYDWMPNAKIPVQERMKLISNLAVAVKFSRADVSAIERAVREDSEVRITREKLCLRQMAGKYPKMVDRWEQLETLSFTDPQLLEASNTFLYGFYRASIVLCASAVETQLRRICRSDRDTAAALLSAARQNKMLSRENADHCRDLFQIRNSVVHDGREPSSDNAKLALVVARMLVATLRDCPELP
jgi:hypothetical protein